MSGVTERQLFIVGTALIGAAESSCGLSLIRMRPAVPVCLLTPAQPATLKPTGRFQVSLSFECLCCGFFLFFFCSFLSFGNGKQEREL